MPSKRHTALWRVLAIHLDTKTRSLDSFDRRCQSAEYFHSVLPSLGKDLDYGLQGTFVLNSRWFKRQRNSALPQFLYEHFIKIFYKDGTIRENPVGIRGLRQLLMMFYKFETQFSPEQVEVAVAKYIDADAAVKTADYPEGLEKVRNFFVTLFPDDPKDIRPHHANGATADRISNMNKAAVRRNIPHLMKEYGPQFFFNSYSHANHWCSNNVTEIANPTARLTFVPKDSRGPRSICMEPHEYMFIQKGLQTKLYDHIENYSPAKGFINFTCQDVNKRLAYKGSLDGSFATIDLKDASDMVPWDLLRYLCPPDWFRALKATRSTRVRLPDGTIHPVKKYTSMGSALCFPLEAMLFWSIARTVSPQVWVYGDDIVVPAEYADVTMQALENYGLCINYNKTLTRGFFRESCGGDYYKGEDIGYFHCKSYSENRFIAFCNLITDHYGLGVSEQFIKLHENETGKPIMRHPLSERSRPQPFVFYTDSRASSDVFFQRRYDTDIQCYRQRWLHEFSPTVNDTIDDYDKLFVWLTTRNSCVSPNEENHIMKMVADLDLNNQYLIESLLKDPLSQLDQKLIYEDRKPRTKYSWGVWFEPKRL